MAVSTGGAILGASLFSGIMGDRASKRATEAQVEGSRLATEESRRQFDLTRADTRPYREVGQGALFSLADLLGVPRGTTYDAQPDSTGTYNVPQTGFFKNPAARAMIAPQAAPTTQITPTVSGNVPVQSIEEVLANTPGYRFRLGEMENALQRRQAASGNRFGGKALREAVRYGQDFASNEYDRALERRFRLAGFGPSAVSTSAGAGAQSAANVGNAAINAGNAIAQGALGRASAWNNAVQGGLQNYFTLQAMNQYNPAVSGAFSGGARYAL